MIDTDLVGTSISVLSFLSFVIVSVFLFRLWNMRKEHSAMKIITTSAGTITLAMALINVVIGFTYLRYVFEPIKNISEQSSYAVAYVIYFILWVLGNNYFLNHIARIPRNRIRRFKVVRQILNIEILLTAMLGIYATQLVPFINYGEFVDFTTVVEIAFVLISQLAMITFVYFYKALGQEQQKNASKLTKARIQLMRTTILLQIVLSVVIGVAAGLLIFGLTEDVYIEFFLFLVMNIVSVSTSLIIYSTVNIPNRVRIRFNIAPSRFKYITSSAK